MEGNKEIDGNGSEKIEDNKEVMIENNNNENNDKNLTSTQPNEEENIIEEKKKESEKNNEEENKVENNIEEGNKVENNKEKKKKLENKNKVENNNEEGNKIEENKEENNNEEDKKENKNEGEYKKEENKEENNVENNIIENNIENKTEEGNKTEDNKEENNIENNKIESNKEEKNIENKTEEDNKKEDNKVEDKIENKTEEDNKKEDNNEEEKEKENNSKDKKEEENNNIEKKEEINKIEDKKEEKNNNIKKDEELIKEDEKKEKKVTPLTPEISPEFEEFINQKNEEELFCYDCGRKFKVDFKSSLGSFFSTFEDFEKIFQYSLNCCLPCLDKIIKKFDSSSKLRKENNIPKHETENNISEEDLEEEETKFQISIEKLKEATDEENKFLSDFRNLEKDAYILEKEKTYVENRNKLYETISKKFTYSNLLTDLFDISFDEKFGTINGCKFSDNLGNGDEVNAGWGYIAFLTKLLTIKYEFKSSNLKIYLEGNYSKMIEGNNFYELSFSSGSRTLDQFNEAMKKYLNFLKEFTNYLTGYKKISIDNDDFKFEIDGDKINGKSIIFSEQTKTFEWPECMKYLLTILKFLITKTLGEENQSYRNLVEETLIINKQQK